MSRAIEPGTALPWRAVSTGITANGMDAHQGKYIGNTFSRDFSTETAEANAAYIVGACNALPVLRDALRGAVKEREEWQARTRNVQRDHACAECVPDGPIVVPGFACWYHGARAALALVEKK